MGMHDGFIEERIGRLAIDAGVGALLAEYIRENVLPVYEKNDEGHRLDHIFYVIRRSLLFMEQFEGANADMVFTIAAYHDIAHHVDKDRHEVLSAKAFEDDPDIKRFFTQEQLQVMKDAIEDHRASLEYPPRNDYGKIVSSADRSTDLPAFFRRTHAYSLKHFPGYSKEQNMQRCYDHMKDKYGNGGYAKSYVIDADYDIFLQTIRRLLDDKTAFKSMYEEIINGSANDA